jgi:hypothetical protein
MQLHNIVILELKLSYIIAVLTSMDMWFWDDGNLEMYWNCLSFKN